MKIRINIVFDDDEKLFAKSVPADVFNSAVAFASEKGFDAISEELKAFFKAIYSFKHIGNEGGDFS